MSLDLCKVSFRLGSFELIPNPTSKEESEMTELVKERMGYFHRWVDDVETSKDIPYIKTMALVEDLEDGQVYMVNYDLVKFLRSES